MACGFPSNTPLTAYKYGCRCERCRAAVSEEIKRRLPQKAAWERTHRLTCPTCDGEMTRGSQRCRVCEERDHQANREMVEQLWAEGMKLRELREVMGWSDYTSISRFRAKGWDLPYRKNDSPAVKVAQRESMLAARARRGA